MFDLKKTLSLISRKFKRTFDLIKTHDVSRFMTRFRIIFVDEQYFIFLITRFE